jgi:hypothetical protein
MSSVDLEKNALSQKKIHFVSNFISSAQGLLRVFLSSVSEDQHFNAINPKETP